MQKKHLTLSAVLPSVSLGMKTTSTQTAGTETAVHNLSVSVVQNVPFQRIGDLIVSAFEGGSNYWMEVSKTKKPQKVSFLYDADLGGEEPKIYWPVDYPLNGGSITISDTEGDMPDRVFDLESIQRGLQVMAKDCPRHWQTFLAENDDAETADVFLQCCLYGEIVYG